MAIVAIILGSLGGTLSVLLGWAVFGLGLWGLVQLYFIVGFVVAGGILAAGLTRKRPAPETPSATKAKAANTRSLQRA